MNSFSTQCSRPSTRKLRTKEKTNQTGFVVNWEWSYEEKSASSSCSANTKEFQKEKEMKSESIWYVRFSFHFTIASFHCWKRLIFRFLHLVAHRKPSSSFQHHQCQWTSMLIFCNIEKKVKKISSSSLNFKMFVCFVSFLVSRWLWRRSLPPLDRSPKQKRMNEKCLWKVEEKPSCRLKSSRDWGYLRLLNYLPTMKLMEKLPTPAAARWIERKKEKNNHKLQLCLIRIDNVSILRCFLYDGRGRRRGEEEDLTCSRFASASVDMWTTIHRSKLSQDWVLFCYSTSRGFVCS